MPTSERGVYDKFYGIRRTDGRDGPGDKHEGCYYFVLDTQHDKHAKAALLAYAESCRGEYPLLAEDIEARIASGQWPCGEPCPSGGGGR